MAIINKETIISAFDDKMTLLQYLKNIDKVLQEGVLKDVAIIRVDEGHIKIRFNFMDGTTQDTNEIVLGTADLATIETLIEGSESIIVDVNEQNTALEIHIDAEVMQRINRALTLPTMTPTEQKLVGIDTANGQNLLNLGQGLQIEGDDVRVGGTIDAEVIESMADYNFVINEQNGYTKDVVFAGIAKNGNKLTCVVAINLTKTSEDASGFVSIGSFNIPTNIGNKLFPFTLVNETILDVRKNNAFSSLTASKEVVSYTQKQSNTRIQLLNFITDFTLNTPYYLRYEVTFLLSDNLAG